MLILWDSLGLSRRPKGILHLGANTGEELETYIKAGIPKVVWFECNKRVLPYLEMNVGATPGHHIIEAAVSDKDGKELEFHLTNNDASSSLLKLGKHKELYPNITEVKTLKVKTRTVDSLLPEHNFKPEEFDFINLDLQGYELKALQGMLTVLPHTQWVYTEVNFGEVYKGCCLVEDLDKFLAQYGFKRKITADTGLLWGDAMYEKQ